MITSISRRALLMSAASLAAAPDPARVMAYIGTYTPKGKGIHIFSVNPRTGSLTPAGIFPSSTSPGWLALHPSKKFMYAANEVSKGSICALSIHPGTGELTLLNTMTSGGSGPAHCSVDPSGKYVLAANYGSGSVAVIPIRPDGSLGDPTDIRKDRSACTPDCPLGPNQPARAPAGSFAISGHDAPHAHMIQADPAGNFVFVNDLGLDKTIVWKFDRAAGHLTDPRTVASSPGAGPRHFAFHPSGRFVYSLNEEASTLAFMSYDAATGTPALIDEISTLPAEFKGTNFTSEIVISAGGRSLYVCNRLHNSVAVFRIDNSGRPHLAGEAWTSGDYPRNCSLDPSGRLLYCCHDKSDNVTAFRVNQHDGSLKFTGEYTAVGSPSAIVFLSL